MPKGRKKSNSNKDKVSLGSFPPGKSGRDISDDEESMAENMSVISDCSELHSQEGEVDETSKWEQLEEKLRELIDSSTDKSAQTRLESVKSLCKAFSNKLLVQFLLDRRVTISDICERCMKKGRGLERGLGGDLAALLSIQLATFVDAGAVYQDLSGVLQQTLADTTVVATSRAKIAGALGLCTFIACDGAEEINNVMSSLRSIFSSSFLKGDGGVPNNTADVQLLHAAALSSWSLLLTLLPCSMVYRMAESNLKNMAELLSASNVELRIVAGETVALFYEMCTEHDEDYISSTHDELCLILRQLATDSQKFRAKKDRKTQRSSFRDILATVEEQSCPSELIKFGRETVTLYSWRRKRHYDAFKQLLGSGMNLHLSENELLRDVFQLGPVLPSQALGSTDKITKLERHQANLANSKARNMSRNKFRDKRTAIV